MAEQILNDRYWCEVVDFLNKNQKYLKRVYADNEFREFGLPIISEYSESVRAKSDTAIVVHKGKNLNAALVLGLISESSPVFANEVFVIFSGNSNLKREDESVHYKSLLQKLKDAGREFVGLTSKSDERQTVYLGNNKALTKTIYGHKIIVDTRDLSLAPHILLDGYWERWISNVFIELIKPGMSVLDIGANIGFYSLLAAERIGKSGHLTCFEANPELADLVFQNMQINGFGERSKVVNKAVYSEDGSLTFNIYEKFLGSSSLWADEAHVESYRDKIKKIMVDGVMLDSYLPPGTKVDFIKIDAEGAEPFILKGSKRIIKDNPEIMIMMEFAPAIIAVAYGDIKSFYDEIRSYGFSIWKIEHDSTIKELHREDVLNAGHCDVVLKR